MASALPTIAEARSERDHEDAHKEDAAMESKHATESGGSGERRRRSRSRSRDRQRRRTDDRSARSRDDSRDRSSSRAHSPSSSPDYGASAASRARHAAFESDAAWASQVPSTAAPSASWLREQLHHSASQKGPVSSPRDGDVRNDNRAAQSPSWHSPTLARAAAADDTPPYTASSSAAGGGRRLTEEKRKRHQYESDDSAASSPVRGSRNALSRSGSAASVARPAPAAASSDPSASPHSISALLPPSSSSASASVPAPYHDPSIFGCRKVSCYTRLNCFTDDHEVLTAQGFKSLSAVQEHFTHHATLSIACYVNDRLEYHDITVAKLTVQHSTDEPVTLVEFSGSKQNGVSLVATDNHRMWLRMGRTEPGGGARQWLRVDSERVEPPFDIHSAADVVAAGAEHESTQVQFRAQFEAGVLGAPFASLSFVSALGLVTEAQVDAFCEIYGYWLGDGYLEGTACKLGFAPVKQTDGLYLERLFVQAGLPELPESTRGEHGYWRQQGTSSGGQRVYFICSRAWWVYFAAEYGHKYSGIVALSSATRPRTLPVNTQVLLAVQAPALPPCPPKEENIKSAKWMMYWAKATGFGRRRARLLLKGLRFADGDQAADAKHGGKIGTSSERFRDEVLLLALHAGYSVDFDCETKTDEFKGTNQRGVAIFARNHHWKVRYTEHIQQAQPRVTVATDVSVRTEKATVWCVTAPTERQLICVRRVLETSTQDDGRRLVMRASRPVIVGNTIDEGTYGVVHRAVDARTGEQVALKKIKLDSNICASGFPVTSLREINILLSLRHPNIVQLKEIVTSGNGKRAPKGIYMVMDYSEHDLKALMNRMGAAISTDPSGHVAPAAFKPFRIPEIKCLLKQLLEGMAYLHENWILHRDLKTSNLLYNNQGQLKICDFGLARRYGDPLGNYTPLVVTLWYRAPELLFGAKTYSSAIDMWSVGAIFAELVLNKPLFTAQTEIEQISRILKVIGTPDLDDWPEFAELDYGKTYSFTKTMPNRLRESFPQRSYTGGSVLSDTGFHLLSQMLCYNPAKRITAAEALAHPYFAEAPLAQSLALMPTFPSSNDAVRNQEAGPTSGDLKRAREQEMIGGFRM